MTHRSTLIALIAGALVPALPAVAAAQTTPPPTTPPATTPPATTPPVQTPPAPAVALSVAPELVRVQNGRGYALAGQRWQVRVTLAPLVPGQVAIVRFLRRGHTLREVQVPLAPAADGQSAVAVVPFSRATGGRVAVRARLVPTAQVPTAVKARRVRVSIFDHAALGARGMGVRLLQAALARRGYVVGRRGLYDARTARAVLAFRKVTGMARIEVATTDVIRRVARGGGVFRVRFPRNGRHVEADLSRQVIALIRGRRVERIYPISSGKPSTPTILGHFRVYLKSPGFNAKGMYFSSYFIRGYAIHGYASVPTFAASHGCLRVPIPDAVSIYHWLRPGDRVDVYP